MQYPYKYMCMHLCKYAKMIVWSYVSCVFQEITKHVYYIFEIHVKLFLL